MFASMPYIYITSVFSMLWLELRINSVTEIVNKLHTHKLTSIEFFRFRNDDISLLILCAMGQFPTFFSAKRRLIPRI